MENKNSVELSTKSLSSDSLLTFNNQPSELKSISSCENFIEKINIINGKSYIENEKLENNLEKSRKFLSPVPNKILDIIWEENREFLRDKLIFNNDYFSFIWKVGTLYSSSIIGLFY